VAFVLRPGGPVRRVDLGPARPIDEAVSGWRKAIAEGRPGTAARTLGRLVWQPLAEHVPADTRVVYLAPDGALTRLPWAALPGRRGQGVLLEQHGVAVVPHGPFLLERLNNASRPDPHGSLLALGGVSYDKALEPVPLQPGRL